MRKELSYSEAGKIGYEKTKLIHAARFRENIEKYNSNPKKCKFCNDNIPYKKRNCIFCSSSCSAKFNNVGVIRNGKAKMNYNCIECGIKLSFSNEKFCSHRCSKINQWKSLKNKYESGEWWFMSDAGGRHFLRKYLIETFGSICSMCHNTKWGNLPIPLIVDHIDGNASNNNKENVRLICGNCNMTLPTFAGRNRGNGRKYRRDMYTKNRYC